MTLSLHLIATVQGGVRLFIVFPVLRNAVLFPLFIFFFLDIIVYSPTLISESGGK